MIDYSHIFVTRRAGPLGVELETYELAGDSPYVAISWDFIRARFVPGDTISPLKIGPYVLLRVDEDVLTGCIIYVRAEKFGRVHVFMYRATRLIDLAYRRFITTLAVWHLADYRPSQIPS